MTLLDFYKDELKDRPIMPALLAQAGISVPPGRYIRIPSTVYDDTHPSAYVYPNAVCDYGDGNRQYDLLAVARDWLGLQLDQAVALIAELAGVTPPTPFRGEVRRVDYRPIIATPRTDPNTYATYAAQAEGALHSLSTPEARAALDYLLSRGLEASALHYRLGVGDSTVQARAPHRIWQGMVTFPTWYAGQLLALKGRNLLPKGEGREMRNLAGAGTAPYGLRELSGDGAVLIVEGETDVLSVWEAFAGEVNVVGIPGATHWKKLQHPALAGRRFFLCLDTDEAGERAVQEAQRWAADEGRALSVIRGIGDKNQLLCEAGPAHLRRTLEEAVRGVQRRAARRVA
ncbi:toprim domain-containing protein [Deinococcus sp. RL]|uniref:toprim domain-containing protein n=1 Tax=Deinococcus sp. RL TaxID=1489678 RepID=UPI0009DD51F4|nr:toprim domain-containing protein [Deinococcus sp. RL]